MLSLLCVFTVTFTLVNGNYCADCVEVVNEIEKEGCSAVCDVFPFPISTICGYLIGNYCDEIIKWLEGGETPKIICTNLGMCSECICGVCTPVIVSSGRCLSMPNNCGHNFTNSAESSYSSLDNDKFCVDGQCDGNATRYGCCLTCF